MSNRRSYLVVSRPDREINYPVAEAWLEHAFSNRISIDGAQRPLDLQFSINDDELLAWQPDIDDAYDRIATTTENSLLIFVSLPPEFLAKLQEGFNIYQGSIGIRFLPVGLGEQGQRLHSTYPKFGPYLERFFLAALKADPSIPTLPPFTPENEPGVSVGLWNPIEIKVDEVEWDSALQDTKLLKDAVALLPPWLCGEDGLSTYFSEENLTIRANLQSADETSDFASQSLVCSFWKWADAPLLRDLLSSGASVDPFGPAEFNCESGVVQEEQIQTGVVLSISIDHKFENLHNYFATFFGPIGVVGKQPMTNEILRVCCQADLFYLFREKLRIEIRDKPFSGFLDPPQLGIGSHSKDDPYFQFFRKLNDSLPEFLRSEFAKILETNYPNKAANLFVQSYWRPTSEFVSNAEFWNHSYIVNHLIPNESLFDTRELSKRVWPTAGFPEVARTDGGVEVLMGNQKQAKAWLLVALTMPVGATILEGGTFILNNESAKLDSNLQLG